MNKTKKLLLIYFFQLQKILFELYINPYLRSKKKKTFQLVHYLALHLKSLGNEIFLRKMKTSSLHLNIFSFA